MTVDEIIRLDIFGSCRCMFIGVLEQVTRVNDLEGCREHVLRCLSKTRFVKVMCMQIKVNMVRKNVPCE